MAPKLWFLLCCVLISPFAPAQLLQNGDFETHVSSDGSATPVAWSFDGVGGKYGDNAHSGKHALTINNWYFWAQGWACYGAGTSGFDCAGLPVKSNPSALKGWYQYAYGENADQEDSAVCLITVYSNQDTIAHVRTLLGRAEKFKEFKIQIPYSKQAAADTISLVFISSVRGKCAQMSGGNCLYLTIDDLELEANANETIPVQTIAALKLKTNGNAFSIETTDPQLYPCSVCIFDEKGKKAFEKTLNSPANSPINTRLARGRFSWIVTASTGTRFTGNWNLE